MKLDLNTIRAVTLGAAWVEETEEGVLFHRFTKEQEEIYRREKTARELARCSFCAGVRFSFATDSETLRLKGTLQTPLSGRLFYAFELFVNGENAGTITNFPEDFDPHQPTAELPVGPFEKTFSLGKGQKTVDLRLPWSSRVALAEFSLDDGARIEPVRPAKKLICYGDSITQGYDALFPSHRYAAILANGLGAEEFNKGIGGEVFFPALATARDPFEPDYVTVAYGTNDFRHGEPEVFRRDCRAFYRNLSGLYPNARIFAISPIWRKIYINHPSSKFQSLFVVEDIIRGAAAECPNVTFLSGFDLIPHDEKLLSDGFVHPTDEGFAHYGKNLLEAIKKTL